MVAGTKNQPMVYNHVGGVCKPGSFCQGEFEARAYFSAVCQNQAPSCPDALVIRARYQIRNVSLKDQPLIPSFPPDEEFSIPTRGIIPISFADATYKGSCPPFAVLNSVEKSGRLRCVCQPGSEQTGVKNGQPVCSPKAVKCPNNQTHRLIGYTPTMDPICVPRPDWRCRRIDTEETCQGIVQGIELGKCFVEKSSQRDAKKASTGSSITCAKNKHICCTET
jgi:hypothetical protein